MKGVSKKIGAMFSKLPLYAALAILAPFSVMGARLAVAVDDAALAAYRSTFTREMCKGGGTWLRCFQLEPATCDTLTGAIVEKCARAAVENATRPAASEIAVKAVSENIVRCVERSFREKYEAKKLNSQECRNF